MIACIILIGFFTGFYLVPLFTLLQHRAPKTSKGDSIATSNFINITGAIIASLVFYSLDHAAVRSGFSPELPEKGEPINGILQSVEYHEGHPYRVVIKGVTHEANEKGPNFITYEANEKGPKFILLRMSRHVEKGQEVILRTFVLDEVTYIRIRLAGSEPRTPHNKKRLPELLFLSAGGMTLFTLALLWWQLPDLFLRTRLWLHGLRHYRLEVAGMLRLPYSGPVILVTDAADAEQCNRVLCATDRVTHFLLPTGAGSEDLAQRGRKLLARRQVVGISLPAEANGTDGLIRELASTESAPILPVHYAEIDHPGQRL